MSRIVPFDACLARPGSLLKDHLIRVRKAMEYFFQDEKPALVRLAGLAGVCHDLAKSHADWQEYIQSESVEKGPSHSACGAFFFSYLGYHLLRGLDAWEDHQVDWLYLVRDIADHHSLLKNLSEDRWLKEYEWDKFDLIGIETFLHEQFPELLEIPFGEEELDAWVEEAGEAVEEALQAIYLGYREWEPLPLMEKLQRWRMLATGLIAADRFDVKEIQSQWISEQHHQAHVRSIERYCESQRHHPLATIRETSQGEIMAQLQAQPDARFYTLDMPTGYGKTVTALKMATWLGQTQGYRKIVYVAPYLSILEQTSKAIEKALEEKAMEHHSLAVVDDDEEQRTGAGQLAMEAWAHSIVCTSFQQFSKALFPRRAQDVLRRAFLKDAVIIIDEPQIFSPESWNLFLCGLEGLAALVNLKVIFLSATMPPFHFGLKEKPVSLAVKASGENDRYRLQVLREAMDETSLATFLLENPFMSQAAILNTIADAFLVYQSIQTDRKFLVHGLMTPLHKKVMIEKICAELATSNDKPLYVISTQVLEAGVNVSFQHVARALPILPSIVQAAGRVNRHKEGDELGKITVFPFLRNGKKETRSFIYPKVLQQLTDRLLEEKDEWQESEMSGLVRRYYDEMFRQNTYEANLENIRRAYEGQWEVLSHFQPFAETEMRLPVFVPWDPVEVKPEWIPKSFVKLQTKFQVSNGKEVYERYADRTFLSRLEFDDRKQFMILFHYYVLNLPVKKALRLASKDDYLLHRVPFLHDTDAYDAKIGLIDSYEEYDNII